MEINFKNLRPPANYPVYPPYHTGLYLEEYFYDFYIKNKPLFDKTGYTLIPVFWTNVYITNVNRNLLQHYLNLLPKGKYFTVSQHDDAVSEILPENTLSFEAGGNKNGIPIPLICSPIPEKYKTYTDKTVLCSFTGSITHEIRNEIFSFYGNDKDFHFNVKSWESTVSENNLNVFIDCAKRSKFTLCPRGYGGQSFRIYEAIQLNSVPVIIYDKKWLPFEDVIDWKDFCVLVNLKDLHNIKNLLMNISDDEYNEMLRIGKITYSKYFNMEGMSRKILEMLTDFGRTIK